MSFCGSYSLLSGTYSCLLIQGSLISSVPSSEILYTPSLEPFLPRSNTFTLRFRLALYWFEIAKSDCNAAVTLSYLVSSCLRISYNSFLNFSYLGSRSCILFGFVPSVKFSLIANTRAPSVIPLLWLFSTHDSFTLSGSEFYRIPSLYCLLTKSTQAIS